MRERIRDLTATDTLNGGSHHVSDLFLNRCINRHGARWWNKLVRAVSDFCLQERTITGVSGQSEYELPADFFTLVAVIATDDNIFVDLDRFEAGPEEAALRQLDVSGGGGSNIGAYRYRLQMRLGSGKRLLLRPAPRVSNHSFVVCYCPAWRQLVEDGDVVDGFNGWEEWIVYASCVDVALRQDDEVGGFMTLMGAIDVDMDQYMSSMDVARPARARDVAHDSTLEQLPGEGGYHWGVTVP
jgi:hypothetical protein